MLTFKPAKLVTPKLSKGDYMDVLFKIKESGHSCVEIVFPKDKKAVNITLQLNRNLKRLNDEQHIAVTVRGRVYVVDRLKISNKEVSKNV